MHSRTSTILWAASLIFAMLLIVAPLLTMLKYSVADRSSFVTGGEYTEPLLPNEIEVGQYADLLQREDFLRAGWFSVKIAFLAVFFSLLIGVPIAFVLARLDIPGVGVLLGLIVLIRMFPDICSVIPITEFFALSAFARLPFSIQVALAHTLIALPYVIFICQGVFQTIPRDLEEQATILGASKTYTLLRIILPISLTGLAAASIYVFLLSWNEFIYAYFILFQSATVSLPVYLLRILSYTPQINYLAALSVLLSIPVILFTFAVQRYIVEGATSGSTK